MRERKEWRPASFYAFDAGTLAPTELRIFMIEALPMCSFRFAGDATPLRCRRGGFHSFFSTAARLCSVCELYVVES